MTMDSAPNEFTRNSLSSSISSSVYITNNEENVKKVTVLVKKNNVSIKVQTVSVPFLSMDTDVLLRVFKDYPIFRDEKGFIIVEKKVAYRVNVQSINEPGQNYDYLVDIKSADGPGDQVSFSENCQVLHYPLETVEDGTVDQYSQRRRTPLASVGNLMGIGGSHGTPFRAGEARRTVEDNVDRSFGSVEVWPGSPYKSLRKRNAVADPQQKRDVEARKDDSGRSKTISLRSRKIEVHLSPNKKQPKKKKMIIR